MFELDLNLPLNLNLYRKYRIKFKGNNFEKLIEPIR